MVNCYINYVIYREKLPRYDIDLSFMFTINQEDCDKPVDDAQLLPNDVLESIAKPKPFRKHPLKPVHQN